MEPKKITFGFSKTIKKPQLRLNQKEEFMKNKTELITCLEDNKIKVVNENLPIETNPLIIPLQDSSKTSRALESLKMRKAVLEGTVIEEEENGDKKVIKMENMENLGLNSLEKRAITELLIEARKDFNDNSGENSKLTLVVKPEDLPLEGGEESTLQDYGNIPINEFGMAMLRGMGLKDENIKSKKIQDDICPRPKGMGLGADRAVRRQPMLIPPDENEKLEIKKNSYIKVLAGKYKSQYGQIEGLDDQIGRVNVKLALGGVKESICEYMVQPVSKKEYQTYGKVINSEKYEEYKRKQSEFETKNIKEEKCIKKESGIKTEKYDSSYDKYQKNSDFIREPVKDYNKGFKIEEIRVKGENNGNSDNAKSSTNKNKTDSRLNIDSVKCEVISSKQYNDGNSYPQRKDMFSKHRSRSREFKKNRYESGSDSNDSPERMRHKSSKSKSSKSKKHKKNKYRYSSSEDDKKHKKKTKKSRKSRSRSRSRNRR